MINASNDWFPSIDVSGLLQDEEENKEFLTELGCYAYDDPGVYDGGTDVLFLRDKIDPLNEKDKGLVLTKHPDFILRDTPELANILEEFIAVKGEVSLTELRSFSNLEFEFWMCAKSALQRRQAREGVIDRDIK